MIEMIVEPFRLFLESFHERVDVFFSPAAIEPALVERVLQALAKSSRLVLDSIKQSFDFAIADTVRLSHNLAEGARLKRNQHREEGQHGKQCSVSHRSILALLVKSTTRAKTETNFSEGDKLFATFGGRASLTKKSVDCPWAVNSREIWSVP